MSSKTVHLDFETRSKAPFGRNKESVTAYQYARDPSTGVWCLCYAFGSERVRRWVPVRGEKFPEDLLDALAEGWVFAGHNVGFEWNIWNGLLVPQLGIPELPFEQTDCTAARAAVMALPRSLGEAGAAMGLAVQKDDEGARLMQRMAKPRPPRKGEDPRKTYWWDDDERLERLIRYCERDVAAERALDGVLRPLTQDERELWLLDHRTNMRGVQVDVAFAEKAQRVMEVVEAEYCKTLSKLTGGEVNAPTELGQLKGWLAKKGVEVDSLDKTNIIHLIDGLKARPLADDKANAAVLAALELRQVAGKSSVAKLARFIGLTSADGRMRENFLFHGANTGRLAGKGAQLQNLPSRGGLKWYVAERVIDIVMSEPDPAMAAAWIEMLYGSVPTALSSCLRACITAPPGKKLYVADFSNIEGRVAAWLGNEKWKIKAFRAYDTILYGPDGQPLLDEEGEELRAGPDLYKVTAGQILGIEPTKVSKTNRNVMGKVPELALGFGGGVGAFQSMAQLYNVNMAAYWPTIQDALEKKFIDKAHDNWTTFGAKSGIFIDEWLASEAVKLAWRARHPGIVTCWRDAEDCAIKALENPGHWYSFAGGKCAFGATKIGGVTFLISRLPNGRKLYRAHAKVRTVIKFGKPGKQIEFMGVDSITKRWVKMTTYGGDLFQSFVQAIARDIMYAGWRKVEEAGFDVVLSVHDELGAEGDEERDLGEYIECMTALPSWANGCPVSAAGYVADRYRKD